MHNFIVSCLLVLLANLLAPVECQSSTPTSTEAPCRKDGSEGQHCYRTALCETCSQTELRCYEDTDLSALKSRNFEDTFCGHHGVVLVQSRSGRLENLIPLECSNKICPDQSECRKNPKDGVSYCCSLEKLDGSENGGRNCGPTEGSELDDWTGNRVTYPDDERDETEEPSDDISEAIDTRKSDNISIDERNEAVNEKFKNQLSGQFSSSASPNDISSTESVEEIDEKDLENDLDDQFSSSASPNDISSTESVKEIDEKDLENDLDDQFSSSASPADTTSTHSGHKIVERKDEFNPFVSPTEISSADSEHEKNINVEGRGRVAFSAPVSLTDSISAHSGDMLVHENVRKDDNIEPFDDKSSTTPIIVIDTFPPETTIPDEVLVD